jgi:3-oxoacyl-[acyl-carrier protein] reductase
MDLGLAGRSCIITGASRGIGRAAAQALSREGAHLLLVGRDPEPLAELAAQCGSGAQHLALDVTGSDSGERVVRASLEAFGRLDAVVNNAGTSTVRALPELTDQDWQEQWELHVMAPMRIMRAAAPIMAERGWGRIVNVSSSSGKRPGQRNVAYSVTKAAVLSLSRAFADAYAQRQVLVNAVTPGPVGTELWLAPGGMADQTAQAGGVDREEVLRQVAAGVPVGRMATEQEVADVIVFLCSERASYVTGAAWSVDGGTVPVII